MPTAFFALVNFLFSPEVFLVLCLWTSRLVETISVWTGSERTIKNDFILAQPSAVCYMPYIFQTSVTVTVPTHNCDISQNSGTFFGLENVTIMIGHSTLSYFATSYNRIRRKPLIKSKESSISNYRGGWL